MEGLISPLIPRKERNKMSKITKKQKKLQELLADFQQPASGREALTKLQEVSKEVAKFNETVECHMRLGIEVKHADQQIRSTVVLPAGLGKEVRVCVIAKGPKVNEAKDAGADFYGTEDIIDKISGGWFEFDTLIATPDCMGMLGKLGKVLGPKGLMPNPKTGTVTMEIGKAVKEVKAGKIDFKVDKTGIVHASIGKVSFDAEKLAENAQELLNTIMKLKPQALKGTYVKSIFVSSTMSPGICIDSKTFSAAE